jgi:hypothetical protein
MDFVGYCNVLVCRVIKMRSSPQTSSDTEYGLLIPSRQITQASVYFHPIASSTSHGTQNKEYPIINFRERISISSLFISSSGYVG